MDKMIEVLNLTKSYGDVQAVKGIDFYVERGKLFAFLGPNGAGKSTTIDMISTSLKADSGEVKINGFSLGRDDDKIRSVIGVVFQDSLLDALLTVKENLYVRGSFYNLRGEQLKKGIEKAASATGVNEFLNRPYGKLSGGQRRRADIARALVNTPEILFLDEPTTGLDPQTRRNVWETIRELQRQSGMTVFLTTHYMEEAAEADYVIVIDKGEIAAKGTPTELKEQYTSNLLKMATSEPQEVQKILNEMSLPYKQVADIISVNISRTLDALPVVESCKEYITGFEVLNGTMDDAFIAITGKEIRE
jgi:multidrug/hemolysin transport system ATP-binding protein